MHPIFLEATGLLVPLGLLAANFCFWAWVWDALPARLQELTLAGKVTTRKRDASGLGRHVESSFGGLDVGGRHRFL